MSWWCPGMSGFCAVIRGPFLVFRCHQPHQTEPLQVLRCLHPPPDLAPPPAALTAEHRGLREVAVLDPPAQSAIRDAKSLGNFDLAQDVVIAPLRHPSPRPGLTATSAIPPRPTSPSTPRAWTGSSASRRGPLRTVTRSGSLPGTGISTRWPSQYQPFSRTRRRKSTFVITSLSDAGMTRSCRCRPAGACPLGLRVRARMAVGREQDQGANHTSPDRPAWFPRSASIRSAHSLDLQRCQT
jgi:hypothetical protein